MTISGEYLGYLFKECCLGSAHKKLSVLKGSKIIMVFSFFHSVGKNGHSLSKYPT